MGSQSEGQRDVTDDELKEAVKDLIPAGTQEIADRVGMTRQGVDYRLQKIEALRDSMGVVEEDRPNEDLDAR